MKLRAPIPELDGATTWLNGKVRREELVGEKPLFIHFWSVSCDACKETMSDVTKLIKSYKDELNVIAVHMPRSVEDKNLDKIIEVAAQFNMSQPIYVDNNLKLTDQFDNQYVPAYYVFDKSGALRHFHAGDSGMKMVEQRILRLLNE
jgi:thiol-disulfide isomerase/thioredoxin